MRGAAKLLVLCSLIGCASGFRNGVLSTEEPLRWMTHEGACRGPDCCIKGDADGDCVLPKITTVLAPDGTHTERIRYIMRQSGGFSRWGLADAKGNTIIPPKYDNVMALSSRAMLDTQGTVITSTGTTRLSKHGIQTIERPGSLPTHFAILHEYPDLRHDIAPILPNGTLGATIKGAMVQGGAAGFAAGPFVVVTAAAALTGAPRGSALFDVSGRLLWAGRELRVHQVNSSLRSAGIKASEVGENVVSVLLGPAPIRISDRDPNMYHPIGADGLPVVLPERTVGVVPFGMHDGHSRRSNTPAAGDEVDGWVVVEQHEDKFRYRVGGGWDLTSIEVLANAKKQAVLDDVRLVFSEDFPRGVIVGHRMAKNDWVGFVGQHRSTGGAGEWIDRRQGINDADDLLAASTPELAASILKGDLDRKRAAVNEHVAAAEAKRNTELALASAKSGAGMVEQQARRLAWAKSVLAKYGSDCPGDWSTCRTVAEASVIVGEPAITTWLEKHGSYGAPVADACKSGRASARACALLAEQSANVAAETAEAERRRRNWEQAFRTSAIPAEPTVNVQVMEGGRLQTKTMTLDRYNAIYGNGR